MNRSTRREFLRTSGYAGLATLGTTALRPFVAWANPMGLPIGIQLYTVRGVIQKDTAGTLKELYDIGYREVETAGFGKYTAKEFGQLIKEAGLVCPSAHLPLSEDDLTQAFEDAHALGAAYATSSTLSIVPFHNQRTTTAPGATPAAPAAPLLRSPIGLEGFKKLAARMNDIGAKAKAAGLQYAYHNHDREFEKMPDGSFGYDILLNETDASTVKFEIDCGWMIVGGANPVEYMKKYPSRFRMLHIKDFKAMPARPGERPEGCDLGAGFIDYKPIFATGKSIGIQHLFAEQEGPYAKPEMESAKIDYNYLHSFS
jgi:sugar phosphate isomerase/epimerase